jgi:peptidyl-prolyl cis-trans isomerase NIMA-interacting 1
MRIFGAIVVIGGLLGACGGSPPAPAGSPKGAAEPSRGAQCLQDAAAPREPKPGAPSKIRVSHVLVRHADLDRPLGATRSREQACLRALAAREKLEAGGTWDEVVREFSDAGQDTAGSLGSVSRDDLDPTFANAAFALDVNQLSYVVETPRGFHVIVRTE